MVGLATVVAVAPRWGGDLGVDGHQPPNFGTVPVGQFDAQDVQVTNTGASTLQLDLNNSSNSGGSRDFFPGPALNPASTSCLDQNLNPVRSQPIACAQ